MREITSHFTVTVHLKKYTRFAPCCVLLCYVLVLADSLISLRFTSLTVVLMKQSWASIPLSDGLLAQDLVKSRSHEIRAYSFPIGLKFDRHLGGSTAEMPVKFQSNTIIIASRGFDISRNLEIVRLTAQWIYTLMNIRNYISRVH